MGDAMNGRTGIAGSGCGRVNGEIGAQGRRGGVTPEVVYGCLVTLLLLAGLALPAAGLLTMTEPVTGSFPIGERVNFSGLNTDSDTTSLFLFGPYLDDRGVMLSNTSRKASEGYVDNATVGSDRVWKFSWDTSAAPVVLTEGSYVVYAVTKPADKNTLLGKTYLTVILEFRGRLVPATTPPTETPTETPTPIPTWTQPPPGMEVQVSTAPTDDIPGKFDGHFLVYEAVRGNGDSDIFLYDIATGDTTAVATGPAIQRSPAVSGDHVVYSAYEKGAWNQSDSDLFLFTISTGETTRLTLPGDQVNPRISGNLLAWQDEPPGRSSVNLMLQDLTTGNRMKVPTRMWAYNPDISGDQVIWIDDPAGPVVYRYNIPGRTWSRVTNRTGILGLPVLDRGRIAWADSRNEDRDIYVQDLATGTETRVTEEDGNQFAPSISGDRVAWSDYRNENLDVYQYDLSQGRLSEVSTHPARQTNVQIGGCIVAWSDERNGSLDVYYQELSGCTPPPAIGMISLPEETPVPTDTPVTTRTTPTRRTTVPTTATTPPATPVPTTQSPGFPAAIVLAGIGAALLAWRKSRGPQ